ncbi:hypothetical protein DB895_06220 [Flavobacterium psychrotolerans]|uniref:Uncharacterized protein n=1 Tax=Flavobacterium psychrotolerans TaxID=2169410 RepID=A0A2U1JK93_9FLAO|nr:hypothetical protein DB895_06220 [Flavobacterium psychrotolerans]
MNLKNWASHQNLNKTNLQYKKISIFIELQDTILFKHLKFNTLNKPIFIFFIFYNKLLIEFKFLCQFIGK